MGSLRAEHSTGRRDGCAVNHRLCRGPRGSVDQESGAVPASTGAQVGGPQETGHDVAVSVSLSSRYLRRYRWAAP